jgi:hypothetical protein
LKPATGKCGCNGALTDIFLYLPAKIGVDELDFLSFHRI